jgi:predicted metal-binding membrane protein
LRDAFARQDVVVLAGMTALAGVAWWDLLRDEGMCAAIQAPWHVSDLAAAIVMWSVMMVAMMVPSAVPMTLLYARIQRQRRLGGQAATPAVLFVAGYVIVWTAWSAGAAALQWSLQSLLVMTHELVLPSGSLAGVFLVVAGVYQLTPWKSRCLVHCQSPIGFFVARWRDGWKGALDMGVHHGAYCVGCCWALMGLLFVVGVMNLAWVAGLTAYVVLEKIVPLRRWSAASHAVGVALVAWGLVTMFAA